jgi:hypothetical protein
MDLATEHAQLQAHLSESTSVPGQLQQQQPSDSTPAAAAAPAPPAEHQPPSALDCGPLQSPSCRALQPSEACALPDASLTQSIAATSEIAIRPAGHTSPTNAAIASTHVHSFPSQTDEHHQASRADAHGQSPTLRASGDAWGRLTPVMCSDETPTVVFPSPTIQLPRPQSRTTQRLSWFSADHHGPFGASMSEMALGLEFELGTQAGVPVVFPMSVQVGALLVSDVNSSTCTAIAKASPRYALGHDREALLCPIDAASASTAIDAASSTEFEEATKVGASPGPRPDPDSLRKQSQFLPAAGADHVLELLPALCAGSNVPDADVNFNLGPYASSTQREAATRVSSAPDQLPLPDPQPIATSTGHVDGVLPSSQEQASPPDPQIEFEFRACTPSRASSGALPFPRLDPCASVTDHERAVSLLPKNARACVHAAEILSVLRTRVLCQAQPAAARTRMPLL